MAKGRTDTGTDHGIMDPIYSVGSVLWNGQRRLVEYHGGMYGNGTASLHAVDARTGMALRIDYERMVELGWKRMTVDRWAAETGLIPPKAQHGSMSDPWWLQRERDPIVRFCTQYLQSHPRFAPDAVTGWAAKATARDQSSQDLEWLVRTASRWSWAVHQGERLVDLLMDLFIWRVTMAFLDKLPEDFDWSEAWEGSEYGVFARALLEAAESFATEAVVAGPPEQLALFG
jgi:hypothetical protein